MTEEKKIPFMKGNATIKVGKTWKWDDGYDKQKSLNVADVIQRDQDWPIKFTPHVNLYRDEEIIIRPNKPENEGEKKVEEKKKDGKDAKEDLPF